MTAMWTGLGVAFIAGCFGLANIWFSAKVHRDNRGDHAQTMASVQQLTTSVADIHADVRDTRADVRDIRAVLRDHEHRLDDLEP
jgi:hypothetical protein